jgi:hypothetical protein
VDWWLDVRDEILDVIVHKLSEGSYPSVILAPSQFVEDLIIYWEHFFFRYPFKKNSNLRLQYALK